MKNLIILVIFSFSLSLYADSELFPFGMNYTVYEKDHSLTENESYKTKYKTSMDLCARAGIKWWRPMFAFRWCDVQPGRLDIWDFETEDSLVKWCGERDLHLLPSIGYTADSARHPDTDPLSWEERRRYPPDSTKWDLYKKYVDTLVERYDGDGTSDMPGLENLIPIKYWQFSNEPWGSYFLGDPDQYVEMYESTRVALKTADPTAKILGLCMTSIENKKSDLEWKYFNADSQKIKKIIYDTWEEPLEYLIITIGLEKIDVVSHHFYFWRTDSVMNWIRDLRDIVENKPVWITETGFLNSGRFKAERGTDNLCDLSSFVTYSSDSGEIFRDNVLLKIESDPCIEKLDTFLEVGDTVILEHRTDWYKRDTIIYNGGPLIYKKEDPDLIDTALAIGDTLIIFDFWARERVGKHNPDRQNVSYAERLDSIINTPDFLSDLKVFFFCADNTIHQGYYPPEIRFGNKPNDPTYAPTRYYRQRLHSVYSVIDTMNNPYPACTTMANKILKPKNQILPSTIVNIGQTKTYQAMDCITTNDFTINNGGKVAMEAGDKINIKPGFRVEQGGYFYGATNPRYGEVGIGLSSIKGTAIPKAIKIPEENTKDSIPKVFSCAQNYPNPFVGNTTIKYGLPRDSKVNLCIYNLIGQKVKTLVDAEQSAGYKSVTWDGRTSGGKEAPKGVYFYTFEAGDFKRHHKMILVK